MRQRLWFASITILTGILVAGPPAWSRTPASRSLHGIPHEHVVNQRQDQRELHHENELRRENGEKNRQVNKQEDRDKDRRAGMGMGKMGDMD